MYTVNESTLKIILKRKFGTLVGTLCERLENLELNEVEISQLVSKFKFDLKKDSYNTMREIEEQVSSFSDGVQITVDMIKPTSK